MGTYYYNCIGYGIEMNKDDMPWSDYDYEYDPNFDDWYEKKCLEPLYAKIKYQPYNENGERLPDSTDEDYEKYWDARMKINKENKCPISYCSLGHYEYGEKIVLLVEGTYRSQEYWDSMPLNENDLKVDKKALKAFNEFIKDNNIPVSHNPKWLIFGYAS
jgi:hypothetical protein